MVLISESWLNKKSIQKGFIAYYNQKYKLKLLERVTGNLFFLIPIDPTIQLEEIMETRKKSPNFYQNSRTYNLKTDPFESINISDSHPEIVKLLMDFANQTRQQFGDELTKIKGTMIRPAGIHSRINP